MVNHSSKAGNIEVRTVVVQPKYKGAPLWKWVGRRFASIAYFDPGTFVLGAEILEAGFLLFAGPFALAFAHVERQAAAFDARQPKASKGTTNAKG